MFQGIGYEGCDSYTQASKIMGKTVSYNDKFSGNFAVRVNIFPKSITFSKSNFYIGSHG